MNNDFAVQASILDRDHLRNGVHVPKAGAFVSFEGWIRDHNEGRAVSALEYEIFHELAYTEGEAILREARSKFDIHAARCVHREGLLAIGDCAVWVGVSSSHRREAFDACQFIIDEVKHRLPVWKKEHYVTGANAWVNCTHNHNPAPDPLRPATVSEADFYARHYLLPEIGVAGQEELKKSKLLIIGLGGLGSAAAHCLAAAGVGQIGICDHDQLESSNLHRQILYDTAGVGQTKVDLAVARLKGINPFVHVIPHHEKLTSENIQAMFSAYDLVLDCADQYYTKYLINDAAILYKKPVIQASIYRFEGRLLTIDGNSEGGCLRCLWPDMPKENLVGDCADAGVLGTVPIVFGTLQANEAVKQLIGFGDRLSDGLFTFDLKTLESQIIRRTHNADCTLCGTRPTRTHTEKEHILPLELIISNSDDWDEAKRTYQLVDVREQNEKNSFPLFEAYPLPFSMLDTESLDLITTKPMLIVCGHGQRSLKAASRFRSSGYANAYSLRGGVAALRRIGGRP